jgi:formylglycine-generating enzyme required for sulfatase activity
VTRQPITVAWRVTRVRVMGLLEIYVEDTRPEPDAPGGGSERRLDLATVRGFGDMARAAFIALVMTLGRGRSERELDRAMSAAGNDPDWVRKSSIHSHVSAIRRSGLKVRFERQKYHVVDLEPRQVDALVFRDLRERVRALESSPQADQARPEIIQLCRQAFGLWSEDPAEAHPYLHDEAIFATDRRRYTALKAVYARALLASPEADPSALAEAAEAVEEVRRLDPGSAELTDLTERIARRGELLARRRPPAGAGVPEGEPAWLPRYREYLTELVESIDLRPFGSQVLSASSLDTVYTPLFVKPRSSEQPLPATARQREIGRPPLEQVVERVRRLLIVGESGSGKSTFVQHLCRRHLQDATGVVPFLLELSQFGHLGEGDLDAHDRLPWDAVVRAFVDHLATEGIQATVESVDRLSDSGRAIWLLDGLNEIPSPEIRAGVANAISACVRRWREARFVVTTTDAALAAHGVPPGLERVDIDDFQQSDIESFLMGFASDYYRHRGEEHRMEHWEPLATKVLAEPDLRDLARRPLHLTAIAVIYFTEGWLPESRADLLKAAVSWWISTRARVLRSFVRRARDLDFLFGELSLWMLVGAERPQTRVGKGWVAEQLAELPPFGGNVQRGYEFLDAAVSTGGLLMARGLGDLGMHEAFRDYLAARQIAAKTDDEESGWWSMLRPRLDDPEWRHVLTLVPGCLATLGSDRLDLFFDRLGKSCSGQPKEVRMARVALGGSVLRELTLSGHQLGSVPHWREAVAGVKEVFYVPVDLEVSVLYQAAVAYGLTGDDRLADFDATLAWLDGGEFWMGAQAEDPAGRNHDPDAAPWEGPVRPVAVPPFAIRRYPITVQEYRAFIDAGGYGEAGAHWWPPEARDWREREGHDAPNDWPDQLLVPNAPVTGVSWFECIAYCNWLTERSGRDVVYRLPYEHEWEYAARRGVPAGGQFRWGRRMQAGRDAEANWAGSYLRRKSPVGLFPRSTTPDGVADLFGNVEEWCLDVWQDEAEAVTGTNATPSVARTVIERSTGGWSGEGVKRVVRGGSCVRFSRLCRPTYRSRILPDRRYLTVGFRPVRPADRVASRDAYFAGSERSRSAVRTDAGGDALELPTGS